MLRTPEGQLVILDFGLMTEITEDQRYGLIEAIAHLINRDYDKIGDDFVNMDFIPRGVDTRPIVPALAQVFDVALAGGGAKSINFQELAADLAEITYQFPFRIPPYSALIIRAVSVLEGIALVGNPQFAIIDEASTMLPFRWSNSLRLALPLPMLTRPDLALPTSPSRLRPPDFALPTSPSRLSRPTPISPSGFSPTGRHVCATPFAIWSTATRRRLMSRGSSTCCKRSKSLWRCARATPPPPWSPPLTPH